jgi:hypothetical protein
VVITHVFSVIGVQDFEMGSNFVCNNLYVM